jgi:mono/diheme cytochrome c family protein
VAKPDAKTPAKGKGATAKSEQYFQRVVRPMLAQNCGGCHDGKKKKGGIDLSSTEKIIEGGNTGAGIVPGNAKESLLMQVLLPAGMPHMPPKRQLSPVEIAAVSRWVEGLKDALDEPEEKPTKVAARPKEKSEETPKPMAKAETAPVVQDDEQLASIKLNLAKRFEKDGLTVSARTRYKEIIAKYPKTKAADEARELLDKLQKK